MCASLTPQCQYSELSLKHNVTCYKAVTSCGNFQNSSRIRGQSKTISATFAALQCMHLLSSQKITCMFRNWCSHLVSNRKLEQHRLSTKYDTSSRSSCLLIARNPSFMFFWSQITTPFVQTPVTSETLGTNWKPQYENFKLLWSKSGVNPHRGYVGVNSTDRVFIMSERDSTLGL